MPSGEGGLKEEVLRLFVLSMAQGIGVAFKAQA